MTTSRVRAQLGRTLAMIGLVGLLAPGCDRHSPGAGDDGGSPPDGAVVPDGAVIPDAGADASPDAEIPPGIDPSSPGLEIYYRFDEWMASGYEVENLAGPGYDLRSVTNQATLDATGGFGSALVIDNRGETYSMGAYTPLDAGMRFRFGTAATLEAWTRTWVRDPGGAVLYFGFGSLHVLDGHLGCSFSIDNGNPPNSLTIYYAGILESALPWPRDENWVHLACVYDGHEVRFYANGEHIPAALTEYAPGRWLQNPWVTDPQGAPPASLTGPYDLRLGWSDTYQGAVDEVAVWSVARSAAEVCRDAFGIPGAGGACFLPSP